MSLLSRVRPDLVPVRPLPVPEQRPGPRDRVSDLRPEWVRRAEERRLPAKDLAA